MIRRDDDIAPPLVISWRALVIVLLILGAIIVGGYSLFQTLDPFAGRQFDRVLWHHYAGNGDSDNPRASMVADIKRDISTGTTRNQVMELLGEPDFEKSRSVFKYNLGMWSGFRIDYDSLDIHFDEYGQVVELRVVQH
mgnify:CR=1 FL=1